MRYSFHGKVRATGQPIDGFVEAANSEQAIDRLADQGIIGVYTVRPEPLPPTNAVMLAGDPQAASHGTSAEGVLTQLVDKLTTLVGQVERLLSRPVQHAGPARGEAGGSSRMRSSHPSEMQNSALQAIFQTNMELRRSLERLAGVSPSAMRGGENGHNGAPSSAPGNESRTATVTPVAAVSTSSSTPAVREPAAPPQPRDPPTASIHPSKVREAAVAAPRISMQAHPAA